MNTINTVTFRQKFEAYKRNPVSMILFSLVMFATVLTILFILFFLGYILTVII